ncbi:hypothetical protein LJB84_01765 [Bacteroidales bacterium OttesenSCG-928-J19]|nr:hypothetical protein [Bacteroidales bacterium OttesenSCG-928-J19]
MDAFAAKQIFYLVGIVVVMYFAVRTMKKVKDLPTDEELDEIEQELAEEEDAGDPDLVDEEDEELKKDEDITL